MKHTQDEIISALTVIKETCAEHGECQRCPFIKAGTIGLCAVQGSGVPEKWELNYPDDEWRAIT